MEYSQGGSEVRRLHIVYFLSRNGHNEHPHLIRVHHLSRNGVRLRGSCVYVYSYVKGEPVIFFLLERYIEKIHHYYYFFTLKNKWASSSTPGVFNLRVARSLRAKSNN